MKITIAYIPAEEQEAAASRGDFKRAIRAIRSVQNSSTDPAPIEGVVSYIRREWLHSEAMTA